MVELEIVELRGRICMLGRSLGNYGVVSKIGEGGMGVVYLAKHVTLGRRAAIKVLRPDLSSNQDIVSRFFNEARAATAVRNSGIVEVYDFGFLEDRTAYIIMEYLDGESLASRMRRGRCTISATLTIVRAIARILQAAHEQGIVHRDLKPDNVFLVPDSELASGERVKLLDFGIAKLAHGIGDASHTTTGTVMGTPTYMAPEQCRGAGTVDHRADLYSLGCVAYEMLCGQPPFVAEGPGDVIARHLYFEPAPPRSHRPEVPAELEEIILRLLKKEPRARYSNAAEFLRATDPLMTGTPAAAPPGESLKTEFVATLPVMRDTTLNSAASSSARPRSERSGLRLAAAGAATVVVAFLAVVVAFRAREDDTGGGAAMAALATESKMSESAVPVTAPPAPTSAPAAVAPGATNPPPAGSPSPAAGVQVPPAAVPPGDTVPSPNPATPPTPPPDVTTPPAPAAPSGGAAAAGDAARSTAAAAPTATGASNEARSDDVTSTDAARTHHPHKSPAKPGAKAKPKTSQMATDATPTVPTKTADAAKPTDPGEFPRWTRSLKPGSSAKPTDPAPPGTNGAVTAKPAAPASATGTAGAPAATKPADSASPPAPASPPDAACTRAAFAPVLDAEAPDPAAVNDALVRLGQCRPLLKPDVFNDLRRRLLLSKH